MHAPWAARGKLYLISRLPPQVERDHSLNMQKRSFNYELTSNIFRENFLWVHLSWQTAFNITLPFHFSSFLPLPPLLLLFCFILLLYSSLNTAFFGGIQGDISENKNQFLKGKKNKPNPLPCAVFPDNADWIDFWMSISTGSQVVLGLLRPDEYTALPRQMKDPGQTLTVASEGQVDIAGCRGGSACSVNAAGDSGNSTWVLVMV